jgi:uncharacterized protein (TIGR02611 family)
MHSLTDQLPPEELDVVVRDVADDPISRPHQVLRLLRRSGRKFVVTVVGFAVVAAGLAMLVLPGPGILVVIAGLAILAKEFVWADRMLQKAKTKASQGTTAAKKLFRRRNSAG